MIERILRSSLVAASTLAAAFLLATPATAAAQGTGDDYERAASLRQRMQGGVLNDRVAARWLENGRALWFAVDSPEGGRHWQLVETETGRITPAFDHDRMARALGDLLEEAVDPARLPIQRLVFQGDQVFLLAAGHGQPLVTDRAVTELRPLEGDLSELFGGLRQARRARSVRTGPESGLIFINRTDRPIRLVWRDTSGEPQEYGTIAAGEQHHQHTYAGHVWELLTEDGQRLGIYEAENEPAVVVIDPQEEDSTTRQATTRGAQSDQATTQPNEEAEQRGRPRRDTMSPDGRWVVEFDDHNARLRDSEGGETRPLTEDGKEALSYGGPIHWSPDSKFVVFMRHRPGSDRRVYYVESSPRDQLQPKLHWYEYLKPGDPVPQDRPVMFEIESGREIKFDDTLFDNPWAIREGHWSPDGSEFRFLYNQRGHQVMRGIGVSTGGEVRTIIEETSPTFIDYSQKSYLHRLPETDELIWASERDGWNHLYLYDASSGEVSGQITRGDWVVRGVERVDAEKRQIWFRAGGVVPGQDPYHIHWCRVNFDGSDLVVLTEGDGVHDVEFSPDGQSFIDRYSRVDLPPVTELRRSSDGSLIASLAAANVSGLESAGWQRPERFVAKGRDGETDIWGVIWRPTTFDPGRKYPVIESIYAGPHGAHVPKTFRPLFSQQELAELGFIVVQIDGMGTNHRGKKFHDVAWKNIADAGFPDRKLWIKAAAEHEPAMDITRVGIYGGSAGGQNAMRALLDHHDLYDAAVADCGCHDNRVDKIWWNEAWMGWPVDESYEKSSNVADAHKLQGKLFLVVGEADRNVDPASTMQVVDALIRANKDFELLVVPGGGHGSLGSAYGRRRLYDFFVRALYDAEPRRPSDNAAEASAANQRK